MKAKSIFSFALLFGLILSGCNGNLFDKDNTVQIRIQNVSEFEMENIVVSFPKEEVAYGNLSPNTVSSYIEVQEAYRYAYIETEIEGKKAALIPIDYVGEKTLDSGKYTYRLYVASDNSDAEGEAFQYYLGIELNEN
jgi:hypothetical protein